MIFTGNAGQWQSRVPSPNPAATQHQVVQCGHVWPITLPDVLRSATACTLQQLVDAWHSQAQVFGLSALSRFVALQIPRFEPDGSRVLGQIIAPWKVHLPYVTDPSGTLDHIPYVVHSIIVHEGEHIMQGHYRAVLLEAGALKYVTEDGKKPAKITPKASKQLGSQMYIVLLERSTQPNHSVPEL